MGVPIFEHSALTLLHYFVCNVIIEGSEWLSPHSPGFPDLWMEDHVANQEESLTKTERISSTALKDLFLADLELLEESIWRNEDIGEKRFNFFVSITTAVVGGLVALSTSDRPTSGMLRTAPANIALVALLVFGLIIYHRLMHRDKVTAEYKRETRMIRQKYRELFQSECPGIETYKLEREKKAEKEEGEGDLEYRWKRFKQMGYTQTLGVINGILFATLLMMSTCISRQAAAWSGVALSAVLCFHGAKRHKYDK
jgi:hypothetical protein